MLGWQRDRVKWNHWTNVHGVGRGSRSGCSLSRQTGRCPVFSRTLSKNRTPKRRLTLPLFPLYSRGSVAARIQGGLHGNQVRIAAIPYADFLVQPCTRPSGTTTTAAQPGDTRSIGTRGSCSSVPYGAHHAGGLG